jgi:hypothetical protein
LASYNYAPFGRQESVTSGGKVIERSVYGGFDHVIESGKTDDGGVMKTTKCTFDPFDRTPQVGAHCPSSAVCSTPGGASSAARSASSAASR